MLPGISWSNKKISGHQWWSMICGFHGLNWFKVFKNLNWSVPGSRVTVQRLQLFESYYYIDQDSRYPTLPIGWKGVNNAKRLNLLDRTGLGVFQPGTLNPEPLNLGRYIIWILHANLFTISIILNAEKLVQNHFDSKVDQYENMMSPRFYLKCLIFWCFLR